MIDIVRTPLLGVDWRLQGIVTEITIVQPTFDSYHTYRMDPPHPSPHFSDIYTTCPTDDPHDPQSPCSRFGQTLTPLTSRALVCWTWSDFSPMAATPKARDRTRRGASVPREDKQAAFKMEFMCLLGESKWCFQCSITDGLRF